jgi:hypothetical protein
MKLVIATLLFVVLRPDAGALLLAQSHVPELSRATPKKTPAEIKALARETLFGLRANVKEIPEDPARIKVEARLADALWDLDPKQARSLFVQAFEAIDGIPEPAAADLVPLNSLREKSRLRAEVIHLASSHDSELATTLINAAVKKPDGSAASLTEAEQSALYGHAAAEIVSSDPKRAAELMETGFQRGVSSSLITSLMTLRQKNPEAADGVFRSVLSQAPNGPTALLDISTLGQYAFSAFGSSLAARVGVEDVKLYLGYSVQALIAGDMSPATQMNSPGVAFTTAQILRPYVHAYARQFEPALESELQNIATQVPPAQQDLIGALVQPSDDVDGLLKRAEASGGYTADALYSTAANRLVSRGQAARALEIVAKIENEELRTGLQALILIQAVGKALEEKHPDEAYRYARELSDTRQRCAAFVMVARHYQQAGNLQAALDLLTEAERAVERLHDSPEKASALLAIANATASMDPQRGYDLLLYAIHTINRTELDFTNPSVPLLNQGKLNLGGLTNRSLGVDSPKLDEGFLALGRWDFDKALELSRNFRQKSAAILAQIALCKSVLRKEEQLSRSSRANR